MEDELAEHGTDLTRKRKACKEPDEMRQDVFDRQKEHKRSAVFPWRDEQADR